MVFAVHISDGVLAPAWTAGGWLAAALIVAPSAAVLSWRARHDPAEVPRVGLLTAAFFVASQLHLPLGVTSVHLLLNGLLGVVLRLRAPVAVAVGLGLQALLFGHGGLSTLGVNLAVYSLPAVAAGLVVPPVRRSGVLRRPGVRFAGVSGVSGVWLATAGVAAQWVWVKLRHTADELPSDPAALWVCDPLVAAVVVAAAVAAGLLERRVEPDPDFAVGLLLGAGTALATVGLNVLVLGLGGRDGVGSVAGVVLLAHLPVVLVESVGVGFVVAYLARAKPEWLGGHPASGNTSSNGTSH